MREIPLDLPSGGTPEAVPAQSLPQQEQERKAEAKLFSDKFRQGWATMILQRKIGICSDPLATDGERAVQGIKILPLVLKSGIVAVGVEEVASLSKIAPKDPGERREIWLRGVDSVLDDLYSPDSPIGQQLQGDAYLAERMTDPVNPMPLPDKLSKAEVRLELAYDLVKRVCSANKETAETDKPGPHEPSQWDELKDMLATLFMYDDFDDDPAKPATGKHAMQIMAPRLKLFQQLGILHAPSREVVVDRLQPIKAIVDALHP